jgi:hypothetical protein
MTETRVNALLGVFMVAVGYGICEPLTDRDLDIDFAFAPIRKPFDEAHQSIEEGRDGLDVTCKGLPQLYEGTKSDLGPRHFLQPPLESPCHRGW